MVSIDTVIHRFKCGYFCRSCGAFNIGSGHIRRDYINHEEDAKDEELDTSTDTPKSDRMKENRDRILNAYALIRQNVNAEQKTGYFNADTGNHIEGICSRCGSIQPWARPWKLRKGHIITFWTFLSLILLLVTMIAGAYLLTSSSDLFMDFLLLVGVSVLPALWAFFRAKVAEKINVPQIDAHSESIRQEMQNSPYYQRSYPYIAWEEDSLDLEDERARRMVAQLSKAQDNAPKLIFTCGDCSHEAHTSLQMQGRSCWCPQCGALMEETGSIAAPPEIHVPSWVCAQCGTSNLESVKNCQGCGVIKAWSDARTKT